MNPPSKSLESAELSAEDQALADALAAKAERVRIAEENKVRNDALRGPAKNRLRRKRARSRARARARRK